MSVQRRPPAGTARLCSGCRTRCRSLAAPRSSGALAGAVGLRASAGHTSFLCPVRGWGGGAGRYSLL